MYINGDKIYYFKNYNIYEYTTNDMEKNSKLILFMNENKIEQHFSNGEKIVKK